MATLARLSATPAKEMDSDLFGARKNFTTIFHASPAILCIIQLNGLRYCEINRAYERCTGFSRSEVLGKLSLRLGLWSNAEARDQVFQKLLAHGCVPRHEALFWTKSGEPLITHLSAEIIQFDGKPCALVIAEDITIRQQAEEARSVLAQRLINAQEAECRRVGQELHDSVNHSLAMLIMDVERTRLTLTDPSPDTFAGLTRFSSKLKELSHDVSSLSHRLHSSKLEMLGLEVAVKALSREFSKQSQINTLCECFSVPDILSPDVSLCFFRVTQEALHNIAKHSQATKIDIELNGTSDSLHLSISDNGIGFAQNAPNAKPGLGLISMRERVHLIGGEFIITSKPGSGTQVEAIVPIAKADSASLQPHFSLSHIN